MITTGVLDQVGTVAESYVHSYDGAVTITNASGGTIPTSAIGWHQGYGRMYRDAESGLLHAVRRYYDPTVGRFTTEDPFDRWFDPGNLGNGYSWLGNRYQNGWDPIGLRDASRVAPPIVYSNKGSKDQRKANILSAIADHNKTADKKFQIGPTLAEAYANEIVNGKETARAFQVFLPWPMKCACDSCHWEIINVRYFTILPDDATKELKDHEEEHHDLFDELAQQYANDPLGGDDATAANKETSGKEAREQELANLHAWVAQ